MAASLPLMVLDAAPESSANRNSWPLILGVTMTLSPCMVTGIGWVFREQAAAAGRATLSSPAAARAVAAINRTVMRVPNPQGVRRRRRGHS